MEKRTLYEIRKEKELLQREIAEASFVSPTFYSFVERGERIPSMRAASRMAQILGISLDEFFHSLGGEGSTMSTFPMDGVEEWIYQLDL